MSIESRSETASELRLRQHFLALDQRIAALEAAAGEADADTAPRLPALVDEALGIVNDLMRAYAEDAGKSMPDTDDPLEVFKAFVKGDPSLNAVRDNVRELVFYRNCLLQDRADALPARPARMSARTARHIYLYLRTRCIQEKRLTR